MLSLGCEIEFMALDFEGVPEVPGYTIHREYYPHMWEINSFKTEATNVPQLVRKLSEHVSAVTEALAAYDPVYVYATPVHNGLAFTGIHLHVQDTEHIPTLDGLSSLSEAKCMAHSVGAVAVGHVARNRGLSLRQVASHHIWGSERQSTSSWKRSARYNPCLFNRTHRTYELRFIDFDQVLPCNSRKLISLLKSVFSVIDGTRQVQDHEHALYKALSRVSGDTVIAEEAGHTEQDSDGDDVWVEDHYRQDMLDEVMTVLNNHHVDPLFTIEKGMTGCRFITSKETRVRNQEVVETDVRYKINAGGRVSWAEAPSRHSFVTPVTDGMLDDRRRSRARAEDAALLTTTANRECVNSDIASAVDAFRSSVSVSSLIERSSARAILTLEGLRNRTSRQNALLYAAMVISKHMHGLSPEESMVLRKLENLVYANHDLGSTRVRSVVTCKPTLALMACVPLVFPVGTRQLDRTNRILTYADTYLAAVRDFVATGDVWEAEQPSPTNQRTFPCDPCRPETWDNVALGVVHTILTRERNHRGFWTHEIEIADFIDDERRARRGDLQTIFDGCKACVDNAYSQGFGFDAPDTAAENTYASVSSRLFDAASSLTSIENRYDEQVITPSLFIPFIPTAETHDSYTIDWRNTVPTITGIDWTDTTLPGVEDFSVRERIRQRLLASNHTEDTE